MEIFSHKYRRRSSVYTKYLKAVISYRGLQRIETYPVPEPALREALLNAVIHKDYTAGTPVQISVYEDKLMIWNPGHLPSDWTVAKLLSKHSSRPFNPNVANIFFRAGEVEAWGRGIERILSACREARFPEPQIEHETAGIWITFPFSFELMTRANATQEPEGGSETREKILTLILRNPSISTIELAEILGISRKGIEWQIRQLKQQGILKRIGAAKGGHWEISDNGGI